MSRWWFLRLIVAIVTLLAQIVGSHSTVKARQIFISPVFQNYGTSWIAGPEGHHYQFHLSEQSWNIAREYCLALASDLVVIKSLQQINWLISHYPFSNSIMPERTIQIGLVLVDKENSAEKEWKWVDNTPLNATYLEWEILVRNTTEKALEPTERGRCALLSIDNRILKAIPCDQTPDFDYTNRFICQRNDEQHREHERKNNPFYELFVQWISELRKDTLVKSQPRTVQLQGVRTQIANVQGKVEDLSPISGKKENVIGEDKEDSFSGGQKIIAEKTLTTADPDVEGTDVDFATKQTEKEKQKEAENETGSRNKHELQSKNFTAKGKSIVRKGNTRNNEDVPMNNGKENGFKRNVTILISSLNPLEEKSQQSSELCGENETAQKDSRTWYEQFGDIFRNLNLFLKQEKSSDLRALLDNNDTNKTLVERLKEALHAKSSRELSKLDTIEKKRVLQKMNDQQQFDDSIQEVYDISNTLAHESDINSVFPYKKNTGVALQKVEGRPVIDHMYDTTKLNRTEIYRKEELAKRSEVNEGEIYELLRKKLQSIFTGRIRNVSNLDNDATIMSDETSKDIKSNTSEKQINQNEVQIYYDVANEQKPGSPSLLPADRHNNITKEATSVPRTFINNTEQITKRQNESNNGTENSLEFVSGNIILLEERKVDRNKTNINLDIEKAISNMKQNLENASEEIRRLFSHSRSWL
ncbi:lectin C-type domain-containing protein [Wuchereria bancrofti]|uniref:Lectin C-type domain-containing protein n=1 Tax=Wuchereria bancrofti TaxID=6293 RepID=J9ERG4_WUCBA|nr:lectin C-type domain-containing protein [Wuchereria bancrofti]VDM22106.1 unnamed protein product [Wuchereria bancrofti]